MYSIRKKLNHSIIISMILVLTVAAVFLYLLIARQVEKVFDVSLLDKSHALISLIELDIEGLEFDFSEDGVMPEFDAGVAPQYYQLWKNGSDLLIKSPSLAEKDLPRSGIELGRHRIADLNLADGREGRLIEITFMPRIEVEDKGDPDYVDPSEYPPAYPITLVFARERQSLDDTLVAIGSTIAGVIIFVLLLSAFLIHRLVGNGLSPLSRLARQVGEIDESSLDLRLSHQGDQSIEIAPIENQLNHLLHKLDMAFEREKRFSSNVAHELRTPLSELRNLAEVAYLVTDDPRQIAEFFTDVGEISAQMEKIVNTLLELARSDAGLLRSHPEDIHLARYCEIIWKQAVNGQGQGRSLRKKIPEELIVNTDCEKLGIILSNLFVNAVTYSPENAQIHIDAEIRYDRVVLEVRNTSVDLQPEDVMHMKDRFWRKQKATASFGHSGLGLSLVEAMAGILDLNISLKLENPDSFLVTISGLSLALHN